MEPVMKSVFWGLFFSSVMVQFTGCQDGSSSGKAVGVKFTPGKDSATLAKDKAAKDEKAKADAEKLKADAKTLTTGADGAPLTVEQRKAKLIALHQVVLGQAHQFFTESWRLAVGNKDAVKASVFSQTLEQIKSVANEDGTLLAKETGRKCSNEEIQIKVRERTTTQNKEIVDLYTADCNGKPLQWMMRSVQMSPGAMQIHFNPMLLTEGAGNRLRGIALKNNDRRIDVYCYLNFLGTGRVSMLSCTHLGQTIDSDHHLEFETFTYNMNAATILDFKSVQYGSDFETLRVNECDKIVSVPTEGKISVHEVCRPPMKAEPAQEIPALPPSNALLSPVGKDVNGQELGKPLEVETVDTQGPPSARVEKAEGAVAAPTAVKAVTPAPSAPVKPVKPKDERDNQPPVPADEVQKPDLAPAAQTEVKDEVK